jgi:hypothetical protein
MPHVSKVTNYYIIFDLNTKIDASERFPFLRIVHDDFSEWMMTKS